MKKFSTLSMASIALATLPFLTSCQDEDFGYTTQEVRNSVYARNFENHYGKVAADQTWDFSSFNLNRLGLEGGPTSSSATRAATPYTGQVSATTATGISSSTGDNYYTVDPNTISWLNNNLKEGIDNRRLGNPFSLVVSKDNDNNKLDFVIIPIYQGQAGMQWDLHLVAKDPSDQVVKDYNVWSKSGDIQYQNNYNNWVEFFYDSDSSDDYDTDNKSSDNSTLKLKNAFPNITSASSGKIKIRFVIPAGKKIEGKFTISGSQDNLPDELKPSSNYSWNNESGSTDMTIDIDLTNLDKSNFANLQFEFWNATQRYDHDGWDPNFVNCYEQVRMHVYTTYNYAETDWTTPPTDSFVMGHTINRTSVHSKGIIIDSDKIDDDFFLYLKITSGQDGYASNNACQRSDEGMMLALTNCTAPTNLVNEIKTLTGRDMAEGEYFIIGCEDANQNGSDHDINDICFLIAGLPKAPKIKETIKKRYMIEDLGSTFDWDFNDIVVDVTQTRLKSVSGVIDDSQTSTSATLYHLCGTIPFKVQVGNTVLGSGYNEGVYPGNNANCSKGGNGYKPQNNDVYYTDDRLRNVPVSGWIPENNNITVTTWPNIAGWDPYTNQANGLENTPLNDGEQFHFPASGTKFPYIIACDQDIEPQTESNNVPVSWFYTKPVIEDNNNNGGNTGGNDGGNSGNSDDHTITWNNNYSYALNSWSNKVELPASEFQNIAVGDNIVAYFTKNGDTDHNAAMKPINSNDEYPNMNKDWNNNTITLSVTESNINTLKSNGMKIIGQNVIFNRIVLSKPINVTATTKVQNTDNTVPGDDNITKTNNSSSVTLTANENVYTDSYFYKFVEWQNADGTQASTNRSFSVSEEGTYTAIYKIISNVFSLSDKKFTDNAPSFRLEDGTYSVRIKNKDNDTSVNGLKAGDKIIVSISEVTSGAKYVVKEATNSWETTIVNSTEISQDATSFSFEVTNNNIDNLKAGFAIQCQNAGFTVTGITVEEGAQKPTVGTYSFGAANMTFDLDEWSYHVDMDKSNFSNIQNGDVIKVTFAKDGGTATIKVPTGEWAEYSGLTKDFNSNPATITLTVSDNNRQNLKDYGLAIQGQNVTFVKAELVKKTSSTDDETEKTIMNTETQATQDGEVYKYSFSISDDLLSSGYTKIKVALKDTYDSSSWIQICFNGSEWKDLANNSGTNNEFVFDISNDAKTIIDDSKDNKSLVIQGGSTYTITSIVVTKQ